MLWNWALAVCIRAPAGHSILPQERMAWIGIWKVSIRLLPGCAAVQGSGGPRIRRIAIGQVVCGGTGARWHIPMGKVWGSLGQGYQGASRTLPAGMNLALLY